MSFNVLVIPEDPTHNGYILKPLVEALCEDAGKPQAKIKLLEIPKLGGYDQATKAIRTELPERYHFMDLWIFFPDADRASDAAMKALENEVAERGIRLFCCPARPEVEIYACATFRTEIDIPWEEVRTHPRMKEDIFLPLLEKHGDRARPGNGRDVMIDGALRNLPLLFQLCPELKLLRDRIEQLIDEH